MIIKTIIEILLIVALVYGYMREEEIAKWEQEVLIPKLKSIIKD